MANQSIYDAFERMWAHISGSSGGGTVTNYVPIVSGASSDGVTYTATVDDFELEAGRMIVFVPARVSASTSATLNINSTGAKGIRQSTTANTSTKLSPASSSWLAANYPVLLYYDGSYWRTVGTRTNANDMYGTLALTKGGTGATTVANARVNLGVSSFYDDPATAESLSASGYYYIKALYNSAYYDIGIVHWDGATVTYVPVAFSYYLIISATGALTMCNSSASTVGATFYVTSMAQ